MYETVFRPQYTTLVYQICIASCKYQEPRHQMSCGPTLVGPGHTLAHLTFLPVEKVGDRCPVTLRQREKDLINRTGVLAAGLNIYR